MKQYSVAGRLMLVGKAWEIRHQLRQMTKQSGGNGRSSLKPVPTLGEYLENRRPICR